MPNAQHIMTSIVKKLGVSVEFITADFADTVAALAYHRKADILDIYQATTLFKKLNSSPELWIMN